MRIRFHSFEERGVYVGFSGRAVVLARCRRKLDDSGDFELLIPNWTGVSDISSSDLVMPLDGLPDWATLNPRDERLFEELRRQRDALEGHLDPILMRDIRLAIDVDFGDAYERATAREEREIARLDVQNAYLEILAMFGRRYAHVLGNAELAHVTARVLTRLLDEDAEEMRRLVRLISGAVVEGASISREALAGRLDALSAFAAPICSLVTEDPTRSVGYLSRQQGMLERLVRQVQDHAGGRDDDIGDAARVIDLNASAFLAYAEDKARRIRVALLDERSYLSDTTYAELKETVARERIRISYALDGWADHAGRWATVAGEDEAAKNQVIAGMLRDMPNPTREIEQEMARLDGGRGLMTLRTALVKEMHSWSNDELDTELFERVRKSREGGAASG